jgi:hypothetical protein
MELLIPYVPRTHERSASSSTGFERNAKVPTLNAAA